MIYFSVSDGCCSFLLFCINSRVHMAPGKVLECRPSWESPGKVLENEPSWEKLLKFWLSWNFSWIFGIGLIKIPNLTPCASQLMTSQQNFQSCYSVSVISSWNCKTVKSTLTVTVTYTFENIAISLRTKLVLLQLTYINFTRAVVTN